MSNLNGQLPDTPNNLTSISTEDNVELPFNAGRFIASLRASGYDVYTATADLVDNCVDAGATKVWIDIMPSTVAKENGGTKKEIDINSKYYIADNGCGMNEETLLQAMALGSDTPHNSRIDLGKFGVGLNTACLGLAREFTILTKEKNGPLLRSTFSCEQIIRAGKLVVSRPSLASKKDGELFDQITKNSPSGTIVLMSGLDKFGLVDPNSFKGTLKGHNKLARTFRFMLAGPLKIFVGSSQVEPADPIKWDSEHTRQYTQGWEKLIVGEGTKNQGTISYRIAKYTAPTATSKSYGSGGSARTQGVIWIRNEREIKSAIESRLFPFASRMNGLWVEIKFTGNLLDDAIGLTMRKDDVKPGQKLMDRLCDKLRPILNTIRSEIESTSRAKSKASSNIKETLDEFCSDVKNIQNLLDLPPVESSIASFNESGTTKNKSSKKGNKTNGTNSMTPQFNSNADITFAYNTKQQFTIETQPLKKLGILYEAEQRENTIRLILNEDHDFISQNLIGTSEETVQGVAIRVLQALALSELQVLDEHKQAFEDFKIRFNTNLRVLTTST